MHDTEKLSIDSIVVRTANTLDTEVHQEIVALSVDTGAFYGLNQVGSRIWKVIAEPNRIADMCARLVAEYDVEPATCERQVLELVEQLRSEGLVNVVTSSELAAS